MTEYRTKYGTFEEVLNRLSFDKVGIVSRDVTRLLTQDVPSFVRLDQTFGAGSAHQWVYSHLKQLMLLFSIDATQMADIQVQQLAATIASNYTTMKLSEFMWFESRFLSGAYERFYGKTSYFLVITCALNAFKEELNQRYAQIEREKANKPVEPGMAPEELRQRMAEGQYPNLARLFSQKKPFSAEPKEDINNLRESCRSAKSLIDNEMNFDDEQLGIAKYSFKKRNKLSPESFYNKYSYLLDQKPDKK